METEEPFSELEKECAQYVAGYVANHFPSKYPHLISHTDKIASNQIVGHNVFQKEI